MSTAQEEPTAMPVTSPVRPDQHTSLRSPLQRVAVGAAGVVALLYGLTFTDVLTIEGASSDDRGILGVAAAVFVGIATSLWVGRSRVLWAAAALLQVVMGAMYLAIAPQRHPSFEVWGVTIRMFSLVLLAALIGLLIGSRRDPGTRAGG